LAIAPLDTMPGTASSLIHSAGDTPANSGGRRRIRRPRLRRLRCRVRGQLDRGPEIGPLLAARRDAHLRRQDARSLARRSWTASRPNHDRSWAQRCHPWSRTTQLGGGL